MLLEKCGWGKQSMMMQRLTGHRPLFYNASSVFSIDLALEACNTAPLLV